MNNKTKTNARFLTPEQARDIADRKREYETRLRDDTAQKIMIDVMARLETQHLQNDTQVEAMVKITWGLTDAFMAARGKK